MFDLIIEYLLLEKQGVMEEIAALRRNSVRLTELIRLAERLRNAPEPR